MLELKVLLRVAKRHLPKVVLLVQSITFQTFSLNLESTNGAASVSEIMKLFSLLSP